MEMEIKSNHLIRKRTRDQIREHMEEKEIYYSHKGKKPAEEEEEEITSSSTDESSSSSSSYKLQKGYKEKFNGVFDFPWLKDGPIFKSDEFLEHEFQLQDYYTFGTDEAIPPGEGGSSFIPSNLDQEHVRIPLHQEVDPTLISSKLIRDDGDDDQSSWSSFLVDDLEPDVDCIWRCVVDQPLDVGLNKA